MISFIMLQAIIWSGPKLTPQQLADTLKPNEYHLIVEYDGPKSYVIPYYGELWQKRSSYAYGVIGIPLVPYWNRCHSLDVYSVTRRCLEYNFNTRRNYEYETRETKRSRGTTRRDRYQGSRWYR